MALTIAGTYLPSIKSSIEDSKHLLEQRGRLWIIETYKPGTTSSNKDS
jgi:hypothetical protein